MNLIMNRKTKATIYNIDEYKKNERDKIELEELKKIEKNKWTNQQAGRIASLAKIIDETSKKFKKDGETKREELE